MPNTKFDLPTEKDDQIKLLDDTFKRAVRATEKLKLLCEALGLDYDEFFNLNDPKFKETENYLSWENGIRNSLGLPIPTNTKSNGYTVTLGQQKIKPKKK